MDQENVLCWNAKQFDLAGRNNKRDVLREGMAAAGAHPVKISKPGSETQRPHGFSHMWNEDPKHEYITVDHLLCRTRL
jgi:hypothetical protein